MYIVQTLTKAVIQQVFKIIITSGTHTPLDVTLGPPSFPACIIRYHCMFKGYSHYGSL